MTDTPVIVPHWDLDGIPDYWDWPPFPIEHVDFDGLILTQELIALDNLFLLSDGVIDTDDYPHVVQVGEDRYLIDGHRRYTVARIRGESGFMARTWTSEEP